MKKSNSNHGKESYDFAVQALGERVDKEDPEIASKMDEMADDLVEDRENGLFEGWAMAADITDRDFSTKMHFNLVSISPM